MLLKFRVHDNGPEIPDFVLFGGLVSATPAIPPRRDAAS